MIEYNLELTNGEKIPAGTMYCIGRNYSKHAKEMGAEVPEEPIVFLKPPTALLNDGDKFEIPEFSNNVHHEVELVVVINKDCHKIEKADAASYILGVGVGLDFTLRDLQQIAKDKGLPWAVAKAFAGSSPVSKIVPIADLKKQIAELEISLTVNGIEKQKETVSAMERSTEDLIYYLAKVFKLRRGDIVFTGTPEGVGQVHSGDKLCAKLDNLLDLNIEII